MVDTVKFSVFAGLRKVLGYQDDIANGRNPNMVTADQIGSYSKTAIDLMLAKKVGTGELPFSQFGDLSFIPPNISSKYEGATPNTTGVVFQVEGDGTRNFLRNGTDGQVSGVYLCRLVTDANGNITGYSPMATPWQPACLPAGDVVLGVFASMPGQVALLCKGTAGGALASASTYSLITRHPGTLNPEMHTDGFIGSLSESIWSINTSLYFRDGNDAYHARMLTESGRPIIRIDKLRDLVNGSGSSSRVTGWVGKDINGTQITAGTDLQLSATGRADNGTAGAYFTSPNGAGGNGFQTEPNLGIHNLSGRNYRIFMVHETWVGLGAASDRKLISRQVDINLSTLAFTWQDDSLGPVVATGDSTALTLQGNCVYDYAKLGYPTLGNYGSCMSRCVRTGEVFAFQMQVAYGTASGAWSPKMTLAQYLAPGTRTDQRKVRGYTPNYPSPVGSSLRNPMLTPSGFISIVSSQGQCLVKNPNFAAPIAYTYPDGTVTTWAVDSGREQVPSAVRTSMAVVMTKAGVIRNCGSAERSRLSCYYQYDDYGQPIVASGQLTVSAAVFDQIEVNVTANLRGITVQELYTQLYFPQLGAPLSGACVAVTTIVATDGRGYSYLSICPMTISNGTLTSISVYAYAQRLSAAVVNGTLKTSAPTSNSLPVYIGEMDDYTFIGGGGPRNFTYTGNAGYPMQAVGVTATEMFSIADYQAHDYGESSPYFFMPTIGVVRHNSGVDNGYAQTMMTGLVYGRTRAGLTATPKQMVMVSQAVYGSWDLYFSDEIYCEIGGVFGYLPKQTLDLSTIKSNPANTTFYIYAQLNADKLEYKVTTPAMAIDKSRVFCGTAITDGTHLSSVNVAKVFSIDGFSLSESQVANAIPASVGSPAGAGVIDWPSL